MPHTTISHTHLFTGYTSTRLRWYSLGDLSLLANGFSSKNSYDKQHINQDNIPMPLIVMSSGRFVRPIHIIRNSLIPEGKR